MFDIIRTTPVIFVFTPKARDMCRSCKRYGKKACCPPHCESLEYYKNTILQYRQAELFYKKYTLTDYKDNVEAGQKSSLELQENLLARRLELTRGGLLFVTCFGGGSCKLCEKCNTICSMPEKSLVPLEAAGIDVFATMSKFGVELPKIITESFYRVGAVLYD